MAPAKKSPADTKRETLIHNERVKLFATWVNGMAIATFAIGTLAPVLAALYERQPAMTDAVFWGASVCFVASAGLHISAASAKGFAVMSDFFLLIAPAIGAIFLAAVVSLIYRRQTQRFDREHPELKPGHRDGSA